MREPKKGSGRLGSWLIHPRGSRIFPRGAIVFPLDFHDVAISPAHPEVDPLIQRLNKPVGAIFPKHLHPGGIMIVIEKVHPVAQKTKRMIYS
jgi:hypothetical protein